MTTGDTLQLGMYEIDEKDFMLKHLLPNELKL